PVASRLGGTNRWKYAGNSQCELQGKSGARVREVTARECFDALQTIEQCVPMQMQRLSGARMIPVAGEEPLERIDQLGRVASVVFLERPEILATEAIKRVWVLDPRD